ncbi:hypothetical protein GA0070607_3760 [Micromonospora coriariae]|uniref:Uncharacterized protein n=1 Tax=Micromonospora coriariae TaxID=285665 RepID=A0A1C4WKV8_9ACTN|nr:hypothetical protein GA0070607_3760 [Micromonospora coriariae]
MTGATDLDRAVTAEPAPIGGARVSRGAGIVTRTDRSNRSAVAYPPPPARSR